METHWTILGPAPTPKGRSPRVLARCSCGRERSVQKSDLTAGRSRSCGCVHGRGLDPAARVQANTEVSPTGCWLWIGTIGGEGYGSLKLNGRREAAHRVSWILARGEIPEGHELDHLCRVRNCVNPEHLEPVPHVVNVLRGEGIAAHNARKTHCIHGHEFTAENTYLWHGHRHCRTCLRNRKAKR